jgi:mono/diheme cytochrome c family protein
LAIVLVIAVLWSGLFAGFIGLTASNAEPAPTEVPVAVAATKTPTPHSTNTPTPTTEPTFTREREATDTPVPTSVPTETPLPPTATPTPVEETAPVSFAGNVQPIFDRRCLKCHGGEKMENDFSVQSYETVLKGSWNGAVIEPGNPDGSYMIELVESGEMPNKGPRLLPAEIEAIRAWIEAGAPNN